MTPNSIFLFEVTFERDVTATLQDRYRGGQQPSPARPVSTILDGTITARHIFKEEFQMHCAR